MCVCSARKLSSSYEVLHTHSKVTPSRFFTPSHLDLLQFLIEACLKVVYRCLELQIMRNLVHVFKHAYIPIQNVALISGTRDAQQ